MPKVHTRGHGRQGEEEKEREKERERTLLWALHLFRSEGRMDRVSKLQSLLVNLKLKSKCEGVKSEQWGHCQSQLSKFSRPFCKGGLHRGVGLGA